MAMIISQANSIRFRRVDNLLPNFDNTLLANELFYNDTIETYCQRFQLSDTETIQMKSDSDTVPTIKAYSPDMTETVIIPTGNTYRSRYATTGGSYDLWFFEFVLLMSNYTEETFITVEQDGINYKSEPFKADPEISEELYSGETLKLEYFNNDNAFQIDFSTGITFAIYVKAVIKDYDSGGEIDYYDNQDEIEKLKETATRLLTLRTLEIPRYLAETLKLASSMDNLLINDVAFVRIDKPEITPIDRHNFVTYTMQVTEKEYIGVNTHDIGFDCDNVTVNDEIMIKSNENATGAIVVPITQAYLIHTLRAQYVSGSPNIKLGTTVGGDELVYPFDLNNSFIQSTVAIHGDISRDADANCYLTITGGVANVDIQLIKNIE